jgi:hypothetical protein
VTVTEGRNRLTCDFVRRTSFAGRYENQKLHDTIIDLATTRLNDKDVFFTNTDENLDARLSL